MCQNAENLTIILLQGTFRVLSLYPLPIRWALSITTSGISHPDSVIKDFTLPKTSSKLSSSEEHLLFLNSTSYRTALSPHIYIPKYSLTSESSSHAPAAGMLLIPVLHVF